MYHTLFLFRSCLMQIISAHLFILGGSLIQRNSAFVLQAAWVSALAKMRGMLLMLLLLKVAGVGVRIIIR